MQLPVLNQMIKVTIPTNERIFWSDGSKSKQRWMMYWQKRHLIGQDCLGDHFE